MRNKLVYASQPYKVGSRKANSWAFIIPAPIVKEYEISAETVLVIKKEINPRRISVQIFDQHVKNGKLPTGESFQASSQQASSQVQ